MLSRSFISVIECATTNQKDHEELLESKCYKNVEANFLAQKLSKIQLPHVRL